MTRATKYNMRITIQQSINTETEIKGWKTTWSNLYTSWASVLPMSGAKGVDFTRLGFIESYEVEMRKRETNVDSDCRVLYNGKPFQITSLIIHDVVKMDIARK